MRHRFVHVRVRGKHMQVWISLLKAFEILIQGKLGLFPDLCSGASILHIPDLDHQLMKGLLLFPGTDLFIIVIDLAVGTCLFGIVPFQVFIEQFMIDRLDRFITVIDIEVSVRRVHIGHLGLLAVMIDRLLTPLGTDRPFHFRLHPFYPLRPQCAFVTFNESNKGTFNGRGIKRCCCALQGAGSPL